MRGPHSVASCSTLHMNDYDQPHVLLAVYGPKGGTRCAEALSIAEAKALRDRLNAALSELPQIKTQ